MGDSDSTADSGDESLSADSVNEKGSSNKLNVLSDPSPGTSSDASNLSLVDFSKYEVRDKISQETLAQLGLLAERLGDTTEEVADEPQYSDQLANFLNNNLVLIYWRAMKKLVGFGYDKETAKLAIFNSGQCHGSNDVLTNVLTGAMAVIVRREKEPNAFRYPVFNDLQELAAYNILEMIRMLRKFRPNLTVTDAMWCLLVSDLNFSNACKVDGVSSSVSSGQKVPGERSALTQSKIKTSGDRSSDFKKPEYPRKLMPHGESSQPKTRDSWPVHQLSIYESHGEASSLATEEAKRKFRGINRECIETSSAATSYEKSGGSRKGSETYSKRDMLQPKAHPFEKKEGGSFKGAMKDNSAAIGNMMLDNLLTSQLGSSSKVRKENGRKFASVAETDGFDEKINNYLSSKSILPAANSKSPASSAPEPNACPDSEVCGSSPSEIIEYLYVPEEEKEKAIQELETMKLALEKEGQGWTDWANKKVMQATRTLQTIQAELKMLRQEKEEAKLLDACTKTKISEMEDEISDATHKIDVSNFRARQLEEENYVLTKEMQAAKSQALESATELQAAIAREQDTLKKSHLLAEKGVLQEQMKDLKNQVAELDNRIENAKERRIQFKVLLKHEEKEKERAAQQIDTLRKKREDHIALTQSEIDKMKQMSETNLRKYEEDIKNLKNEISQLRLKMRISNIAAHNLPETTKRLAAFQDNLGGKSIKWERECVVCMEEEISVVFIPCIHQILCRKCNEVHEKGGQNDCPTCRAVIKERVHVRYRDDQSFPQE